MPVFNQSRSYIIRFIFIATIIIIVAQLFNLQVLSGKYQQLAMNNAVFAKRVYPPRGIRAPSWATATQLRIGRRAPVRVGTWIVSIE